MNIENILSELNSIGRDVRAGESRIKKIPYETGLNIDCYLGVDDNHYNFYIKIAAFIFGSKNFRYAHPIFQRIQKKHCIVFQSKSR